ncbi:Uncharacterised protein [Mycobacteroides abscessus subsp. abscessus]|nr:Uncharacterised protein [Mycobacteroides abscessus subsp. abscessus]
MMSMLLVMPTAVMTESSENTRSNSSICTKTDLNVAAPLDDSLPSGAPSSLRCISWTAL